VSEKAFTGSPVGGSKVEWGISARSVMASLGINCEMKSPRWTASLPLAEFCQTATESETVRATLTLGKQL
jgi:hypothetical protein